MSSDPVVRQLRAELQRRDEEVAHLRADLAARLAERDSARDALRDHQRAAHHLEALGTLSAAVAHDFNNMLTVILSFADLVLAATPSTDPRYEDLQQISRATHKATRLTAQLLTFSRQQSWRPRVLAVDEVLGDLDRLLRRLAGDRVSVVFELAAPEANVLADPARLEQVITNLVANARDAMVDGGVLTIRTAVRSLDRRRADAGFGDLPAGWYVSVSVHDTGIGMTPEVQHRIFEPYFTTKPPGRGTGLGLSTVFGIVQQAHGAVWVTSEEGRGSTFEVVLPVATQPSDLLVLRPPAEASGGTETLLLVERDDLVRAAAATVLRARGYVVLEAAGGREALQVSATYPGPIELLLADPQATDDEGVELLPCLGRVRPDLRILYLAGLPEPTTGTSPRGWLQKPFSAATLSHRVRELLDEH